MSGITFLSHSNLLIDINQSQVGSQGLYPIHM